MKTADMAELMWRDAQKDTTMAGNEDQEEQMKETQKKTRKVTEI